MDVKLTLIVNNKEITLSLLEMIDLRDQLNQLLEIGKRANGTNKDTTEYYTHFLENLKTMPDQVSYKPFITTGTGTDINHIFTTPATSY